MFKSYTILLLTERRRAKRLNKIEIYTQLIMDHNEEIENIIEKA